LVNFNSIQSIKNEYDKFGRQTRVSSDKGNDVRYSYDILGRLKIVTDTIYGSVSQPMNMILLAIWQKQLHKPAQPN
jgi:YD repeat-containing protein